MKRIYLDHNATTLCHPKIWRTLSEWADLPLNPSSVHYFGQRAGGLLATARQNIQEMTGAEEVIFTSGGTEANNLALHLLLHDLMAQGNQPVQLIYFDGDHPSITKFASNVDFFYNHRFPKAIGLPFDRQGFPHVSELEKTLKNISTPTLVAIQLVNHETGIVAPYQAIAQLCQQHNATLFCDGVQFFPYRRFSLKDSNITAISMAGHKLGGIHGAGAVLLRQPLSTITPFQQGGGQELGYRAGSQNTMAIYGMALALQEAQQQQNSLNQQYHDWREKLEEAIKKIRPTVKIIGENNERLDHVTLLLDETIAGDMIVIGLDSLGVAVSSGAACSSGKTGASQTLLAMGYEKNLAKNTLRISMGHNNQSDDIDDFISAYQKIISRHG